MSAPGRNPALCQNMNAIRKLKTTRHGQLAEGKRKVSVVAPASDLRVLEQAAAQDRRSLSAYIALLFEREAERLRAMNN